MNKATNHYRIAKSIPPPDCNTSAVRPFVIRLLTMLRCYYSFQKLIYWLVIYSVFLFTFAFIAPSGRAQPLETPPLQVVTSFSILADLVKHVGGDNVQITNLVKANQDAHSYEPTPQDNKALRQAKLFFINGLDFEPWAKRLQAASGFEGQCIVVSQGITARSLSEEHDAHNHDHAHSEYDPHAWQNVSNTIIYVRNIAQALSAADPAHAQSFEHNAQQYIEKLQALDHAIKQAIEQLPTEQRSIVTTHDAFGYFAQAYGLNVIAAMGMSADADPTAADMARLIKQIKQTGVRAVFLENITNPRLLQQVAKDTGVTVGGTLYTDALSSPGTPAESYLSMMQQNLQTLVEALSK